MYWINSKQPVISMLENQSGVLYLFRNELTLGGKSYSVFNKTEQCSVIL